MRTPVSIAPSNPTILYLGTGEGNPRNSASIGDGVYKSVDGGRPWKKIGLENTEKILRAGELEAEAAAAEARLGGFMNGPIARLHARLKDLPHIVVAGGRIS